MSDATLTKTNTYKIDEAHSTVRFSVRHLMISKVHGEISDITGTVSYDPANPEATVADVTIGLASLTTQQDQRDAHLKSADFFNIEQFPNITFKSTKVVSKGDGEFEVTGDLTMHGVTKAITLKTEVSPEVASPFGGFKIGVSATGVVNREDYGMVYNQALEAGGVMVGKEISLQIDTELDRPA